MSHSATHAYILTCGTWSESLTCAARETVGKILELLGSAIVGALQQLYFAMYYAGFYSTYYGDYYGDHVLRQFSMEALQKRNVNEEAADM